MLPQRLMSIRAGECRYSGHRGTLYQTDCLTLSSAPLQLLGGWGNCPVESCRVIRPETLEALSRAVVSGAEPTYIARGLGRAYGDSALNADSGVLLQTERNRFLQFDRETGVVDCEAGVSLAELITHLLPRGWFLPTTPGTKFVTVGGAIAADVHGKNHHVDGSFGNFVRQLRLLVASGDVLNCSPTENPELFWATIGGMGLTGVIVSARVQLMKVESAWYDVTYRRTRNLDETLEQFSQTDGNFRYSVAWIDCLASGKSLGRSVLMLGNDTRAHELPSHLRAAPLIAPVKRKKSIPFNFPGWALNSLSVRAFNALYYGVHGDKQKFVDWDSYFYPLDSIEHWNRIYGKRGFVQYQALFPKETSAVALRKLLERVAQSGRASFLAVLKSSGAAGEGVLSYLYPGHTLALDFANTGESLRKFLRDLDAILLDFGGRLYLAKDACMSAETFARMYPRADEFRQIKARYDPHNRFSSSQARRLRLG